MPPARVPGLVSRREIRRRLQATAGAKVEPDLVNAVQDALERAFAAAAVTAAQERAAEIGRLRASGIVRDRLGLKKRHLKGYLVIECTYPGADEQPPQEVKSGTSSPEVA